MKSVYMASSVRDLTDLAEKSLPQIDNGTKLILYYRSAQQILMQANIYKREGDFEKAYVHMMKYSILILQRLHKHPQYNQVDVINEKKNAKEMVIRILDEMEGMKLVLQNLYENERLALAKQKEREAEEKLAREQEAEKIRQQEELEKAAQEARTRAEIEQQQQREAERQMELFAQQQLKSSNSGIADNGSGLVPMRPNNSTVVGEDPLIASLQSQVEHLQLQQPPPQQPQDVSSFLPQDFFLQQQQQLLQLPISSPIVQPTLLPPPDLLTPEEPPPSNNSNSPVITTSDQLLVHIPPDVYAPPVPENFSHLNALAPNSTRQENLEPTGDSSKTPVVYPNLYTSTNTNATLPKKTMGPNIPNVPSQIIPPLHNTSPYLAPPTVTRAAQTLPFYHNQVHYVAPSQPPVNLMPSSNFVHPAAYARNPTTVTPAIPYSPPNKTTPTTPSRPAATTTETLAQSNIPSISKGKDIEVSPVDVFGPSKPRNTGGLRKLVVHGEMFEAFMRVANSNTQRNIETCAILSGTLSKDVFHVTTMIVPKQEGTSDTCVTKNEEELFEYQMKNDLLTLGWIHVS